MNVGACVRVHARVRACRYTRACVRVCACEHECTRANRQRKILSYHLTCALSPGLTALGQHSIAYMNNCESIAECSAFVSEVLVHPAVARQDDMCQVWLANTNTTTHFRTTAGSADGQTVVFANTRCNFCVASTPHWFCISAGFVASVVNGGSQAARLSGTHPETSLVRPQWGGSGGSGCHGHCLCGGGGD